MPNRVAIVGCLDTKGDEILFIKGTLEEEGCSVHVIDTGVMGEPVFEAETTRDEVAEAADASLAELRKGGDRGVAMETMARGATKVLRQLYDQGSIDGVIAAGGSANTTIGTQAMRALPVGFPKLMVSTLASGDVAPYVGTKDITMMFSVVDIAGINRISARVLRNAARAVAAMAAGKQEEQTDSRPVIAATMFGVTTPCVMEAKRVLEESGYEVVVFHATGTGGRAMEGLIEDGYIKGVLDITTTELADELVGGILSAGPRRLTVAGAAGIPQVVSVGAVDMVNFGPRDSVPGRFSARKFYQHNPTVTLMRTTAEENAEIGRRIASRLEGTGALSRVLLPLKGVSMIDMEGATFHDPEADEQCFASIRSGIDKATPVVELDMHINDPEFARACAEALLELLEANRGGAEKDNG